jgi:hypothetical protein
MYNLSYNFKRINNILYSKFNNSFFFLPINITKIQFSLILSTKTFKNKFFLVNLLSFFFFVFQGTFLKFRYSVKKVLEIIIIFKKFNLYFLINNYFYLYLLFSKNIKLFYNLKGSFSNKVKDVFTSFTDIQNSLPNYYFRFFYVPFLPIHLHLYHNSSVSNS